MAVRAEALAERRFSPGGPSDALRRLAREAPTRLPRRRGHRRMRARRGPWADLRRTLRETARNDGEVMRLGRLKRRARPRKMLLLIDVSGSMKARSEDNLRLAHTLVQATPNVEVFTFGTRLTRVTRALRLKRREQALAAAAHLVSDWDGGTRIGDALQAFFAVPRFGGYARGAAVVILSDGLERGDLSALRDAVAKLSRRAWRLSWLTPLATGAGFVPQTEALIAIRRFVDDMADGGSNAAVVAHVLVAPTKESRVTGIVDAHHHIWRQADLPWLTGPMQPRIFGPYEPIRRDYPIAEYLDDLAGNGVVKSVYVQTNWANERFEDETAWVQRTAEETGWPHAIVAYADFSADDVRPQLDRLKRYSLVRGVRMQLHWHENPLYRFAARADLCADPAIRRNVARLADYGWSFDLQVFAPQMPDAAGLAEACPDVTFVLQHAGMLEDLSPAGRAAWRAGMARLATVRTLSQSSPGSVHSSIATTPHISPLSLPKRLRSSAPIAACSARIFRSRSCGPTIASLVAGLSRRHEIPSPRHRDAILRDTAMRVYRLAP